jgi:hypothetical protein
MPTISFIPLMNSELMILKHRDLPRVNTAQHLWEDYLQGKKVAFIMTDSLPILLNSSIITIVT